MRIIYLAGHGQWNIKDGYAEVPTKCSISFLTEFSKNMFTSDMKEIISGTSNLTVKTKVEQYKSCPNYTLSADPVSLDDCRNRLTARNNANLSLFMFGAGPSWTLTQVFASLKKHKISADLIWCACRFTGLADAGGKAVGVNGAQGTWGDRDNRGALVAPGGPPNTDLFFFNSTSKVVKNL